MLFDFKGTNKLIKGTPAGERDTNNQEVNIE